MFSAAFPTNSHFVNTCQQNITSFTVAIMSSANCLSPRCAEWRWRSMQSFVAIRAFIWELSEDSNSEVAGVTSVTDRVQPWHSHGQKRGWGDKFFNHIQTALYLKLHYRPFPDSRVLDVGQPLARPHLDMQCSHWRLNVGCALMRYYRHCHRMFRWLSATCWLKAGGGPF